MLVSPVTSRKRGRKGGRRGMEEREGGRRHIALNMLNKIGHILKNNL